MILFSGKKKKKVTIIGYNIKYNKIEYSIYRHNKDILIVKFYYFFSFHLILYYKYNRNEREDSN